MKKKLRPKVIVMIDRAKLNIVQQLRFEVRLFQNRVAEYLSEKEQRLSTNRKKVYFFLFVGIFSSYFLWLTVSSFFIKPHQDLNFGNIHASKIPETINPGRLTFHEMRVLNYIRFLDSLKTTASGKIKYDRILKSNPGLMDTLTFIKSQILPPNK